MFWHITLVVLVLHGFITVSADCETGVLYVASGEDTTLPLNVFNPHEVVWKHNSEVILKSKAGRVNPGQREDITTMGSLKLRALTSAQAGEYRAEVFNKDGQTIKEWSCRLSVIDKVSKPKVTLACPQKSSSFTFNCTVATTQTMTFEWRLNNILRGETEQTISLNQLKGVESLTCSAVNKVSRETSDSFKPVCEDTDCETGVLYVASGEDTTLPLNVFNPHEVVWKHNSEVILKSKAGRVNPGQREDITTMGSLKLRALTSAQAGEYRAEVFNKDGQTIKEWSCRLSVIDKVSKPKVTLACPQKSSSFTFNCTVATTQTMTFEWRLNNILRGETEKTISLNQLKGVESLTCSAVNKVSRETSDSFKPVCEDTDAGDGGSKLLGLPWWTMLGILAGGGGLVLLLILITIVCCCRGHHRRQKRQDDEEELRLASLTQQQQPPTGPARPQHRHKCPSGPECSHPRSVQRAQRKTAAQPRAQAEDRPPQAPQVDDEECPPPLPQARRTDPAPTSTEHRPPLPQARTRPRKH